MPQAKRVAVLRLLAVVEILLPEPFDRARRVYSQCRSLIRRSAAPADDSGVASAAMEALKAQLTNVVMAGRAEIKWRVCNEATGYTCGLWTLFHFLSGRSVRRLLRL